MEKEKHITKFNQACLNLIAVASLSLLPHAIKAEKQEFPPPHPFFRTNDTQYAEKKQSPTLIIPQEKQTESTSTKNVDYEKIYREETESLDQIQQCERYLFGWIRMTDNEREEITKRIITLPSGTHVYLSKTTIDSINNDKNKNDATENEEKYIKKLLDSVSTPTIQKELNSSNFIVIHKKNEEPDQIIVFTTFLPEKKFETSTVEYIPYDGNIHNSDIKTIIDRITSQGF